MIIGVGTDITHILRVKKLLSTYQDKFINKILSPNEIDFALKNSKKINEYHLAKRFSAKESFAKATGLGIGNISFHDIEIFNSSKNNPYILISPLATEMLKKHLQTNQIIVNLSMSDEKYYAISFVILSN